MSFVHVASIMVFIFVLSHFPGGSYSSNKYLHWRDYNTNTTQEPSHAHRKLLVQGESSCTSNDLSIAQSIRSTTGIPEYKVEIVNTCEPRSACAPSNIHFHCGWFASANLVNPMFFKRLSYDDCLVNNGQTLRTGQVIIFYYSNTFMYPISFKYATFC